MPRDLEASAALPPSNAAGIGSRIAAARTARGLSQDDLGSAAGVSRSAVAQWETGRATPLLVHLSALATALGVAVPDLLSEPTNALVRVPAVPFRIRDLSVLAYANGFTLWHYKAHTAPIADWLTPDFFRDAADMLALGDIVMVSGAPGAACLVVSGNAPLTLGRLC